MIFRIAALLVFLLPSISYAQVHWQGRYNGRYYNATYDWNSLCCNNPNCGMRQQIIAQLQRQQRQQRQQAQEPQIPWQYQPRWPITPTQPQTPPSSPPANRTITVQEPYQTQEPYQVQVCVGKDRFGRCIFATQTHYRTVTRYRTVTKQVQAAPQPTAPKATTQPPKAPPATIDKSLTLTNTTLVTTPQKAVERMLQLLDMPKGATYFDLGSGDGRFLIEAAKKYDVTAIGIELDKQRAAQAREEAKKHSARVLIMAGDIRNYDLSDAEYVTMYLYQDLMKEIIPKLPKGAKVASFSNPVPGLETDTHKIRIDGQDFNIYVGYVGGKPSLPVSLTFGL